MESQAQDSDFNWVRARQECSLAFEFNLLRRGVEASTKERISLLPSECATGFSLQKQDPYTFGVTRGPVGALAGRSTVVTFILENDHITIDGGKQPLKITLTLNDEGECRYRINGDGEFKRWQVIRRALEPLFFDPS